MKTVKIRNMELGSGLTKLIIPIVETTPTKIFVQARECKHRQTDIIEWRADYCQEVLNTRTMLTTASKLRRIVGNIPILFTVRPNDMDGSAELSREEYFAINSTMIESGLIDAIDLVIDSEKYHGFELIELAHRHNVVVLGSHNYIQDTPSKEEILDCMHRLQDLGTDIIKVTSMTHSSADAIHLMDACQEMLATDATRPIIAVGMGAHGVITRVGAESFGSCATYGSVGAISAPGQFPVERLRNAIQITHNAIVGTDL